mgnify:CR=1 FL=1
MDIYSLGVIFFEMCYKPLPTGMERVKIISQLRMAEINLPEDLDQLEMERQVWIGRMQFVIGVLSYIKTVM